MEHKFLRLFDSQGVWHGNPDRTIRVNGVVHDMDEYAKSNGITLPTGPTAPIKPKKAKKVNIDIKEQYEDMEQPHHDGDTEVDGDGDSEG